MGSSAIIDFISKNYALHLRVKWLPSKDSNLEREIQNLLCYHYTKGQLADAGEINSRIGRGVKLRVRSVAEVAVDG